MDGCVEAAPGTNNYVLQKVTLPPPATQPTGNNTAECPLITEGAWVRLLPGSDDIRNYMGQLVEVTGHGAAHRGEYSDDALEDV